MILNLFNISKRTLLAFKNKRYETLQDSLHRTKRCFGWKHSPTNLRCIEENKFVGLRRVGLTKVEVMDKRKTVSKSTSAICTEPYFNLKLYTSIKSAFYFKKYGIFIFLMRAAFFDHYMLLFDKTYLSSKLCSSKRNV
jgi:hypothetical protein